MSARTLAIAGGGLETNGVLSPRGVFFFLGMFFFFYFFYSAIDYLKVLWTIMTHAKASKNTSDGLVAGLEM